MLKQKINPAKLLRTNSAGFNWIKKISVFSAIVFIVGFLGAFLGKGFEKTKLGQKIEKKLGIQTRGIDTLSVGSCMQQEDADNSALFVGCNGFF